MHNEDILDIREIVELALAYWTLKKNLNKTLFANDTENNYRPIISNLKRMENAFYKIGIEIIDYTSQKYNEGMNIDIIETIKSENVDFPVIKETIQPCIMLNSQIIKRAKVIKAIKGDSNE